MALPLEEIEAQALLLPTVDREVLIQTLVYSLDNTSLTEVDEAWVQEAERRYQEFKNGKTKGVLGDQVFVDIRRELGWQR
jgi:putative addiction module component (TIGR02574 family)